MASDDPVSRAAPPSMVVHEIETLDLRRVFPREDYDFTPWLGRPENLARLARSLGRESSSLPSRLAPEASAPIFSLATSAMVRSS